MNDTEKDSHFSHLYKEDNNNNRSFLGVILSFEIIHIKFLKQWQTLSEHLASVSNYYIFLFTVLKWKSITVCGQISSGQKLKGKDMIFWTVWMPPKKDTWENSK